MKKSNNQTGEQNGDPQVMFIERVHLPVLTGECKDLRVALVK